MKITEEEFRDLVLSQKKSDISIAHELGVSSLTIAHWRQRFGLPNAYSNRERKPRVFRQKRSKLCVTKEQLYDLYVVQGLPQREISQRCGVNQVTVSNWLKHYGIAARPDGGRIAVLLDEKELQRLYHVEKWSMQAIAQHFKCGESTVRQNLIRFGLQIDMKEVARRKLEKLAAASPYRFEHRGYVKVMVPDHPAANKGGYVDEHRFTAENAIGRPLIPGEQVHHINLRKRENAVGNLAVLPTKRDHFLVHRYLERVAVYLLGLTSVRPEPIQFKTQVFWAGRWVLELDMLRDIRPMAPAVETREAAKEETVN